MRLHATRPLSAALAAALLLGPRAAAAQALTAPMQGDATAMLGWLVVDGSIEVYPSRRYDSLFGGAGAGWYWTDHLKTEIDVGAGTRVRSFANRAIVHEGRHAIESVESEFSRRTLGIGQQYQFFRNAWFHPYIGAGVLVRFENIDEYFAGVVVYDDPRGPRLVEPARDVPPRTERSALPFVNGGFKGYLTQRAFFRMDLRFAFEDGLDETLVRVGFGFDF